MARDRLSDAKVRSAKPAAQPYKLYDGGGLFLLVHPNGSRYWRFKYRFGDKEKLFAIGVYPDVTLSEARAKALDARRIVSEGADPVIERRRHRANSATSAAETFQAMAEEWMASRTDVWSPSYREAVQSALAANLYAQLGQLPIRSISVPVLREALLLMERRARWWRCARCECGRRWSFDMPSQLVEPKMIQRHPFAARSRPIRRALRGPDEAERVRAAVGANLRL
jgi:hypothetical protein